jgi:hypothetical protein
MRLTLSGLLRARRAPERRATHHVSSFRPALETLEGRLVLSQPATFAPPALAAALVAPAAPAAQTGQQLVNQVVSQALNLNITGITTQGSQVLATGTAFGQTFTTPLNATTSPSADPNCPILHLMLGPINLNLLGLNVTTSQICLDITAQHGPGNLLGNLLCDVANLLNQPGATQAGVLNSLSPTDLTTLENGVTSLLNGALHDLNTLPTIGSSSPQAPTVTVPSTNVLSLSLGPVNLNLLGLQVALNNCNNGPVTVNITALQGPGNLLGNLIGDLAHLLDNGVNVGQLNRELQLIAGTINRLLGTL